jgi:signal transduction histidine kinase
LVLAGAGQARQTGLGLAIVGSIVDAHRGTNSVASDSEGNVFTFTLPTMTASRINHWETKRRSAESTR